MSDVLLVLHESTRVGTLTRTGFTYAEEWLDTGFPISASLPLRSASHEQEGLAWFANLLPEGTTRERLARRLRLSPDDDFALLRALGRDCAGALTLLPEGASSNTPSPNYLPLSQAQQLTLLTDATSLPVFQEEGRLSLAGAQDKLPVFVRDGQLELPVHGAASSHILKLPNRDFGNLVENELLCLRLAHAVGLEVAQAQPHFIHDKPALLVKRYDRSSDGNGQLKRLHQEDFVQALGQSRHRKYEQDGGITFAQCVELTRQTSLQPALELRHLLIWLFFNLVIGNRDNHGKNLSRLPQTGASPRWKLAPFYDLVNTTCYKNLSNKLAFSIGGATQIEKLRSPQWTDFAKQLGLPLPFVLAQLTQLIERIDTELEQVRVAVAQELGNDARLAAPTRAIRKTLRAARESVGAI